MNTGNNNLNIKWQKTKTYLNLRFGEYVPYTAFFEAVECRTHFLNLPDALSQEIPLGPMKENKVSAAVVEPCPLPGPIPMISLVKGHFRYVTAQYKQYYVNCSGDFDDYLASFKGKTRGTIKRKVRKFSEELGAQDVFKEYGAGEIEEFLTVARQLSARTWQERFLGRNIQEGPEFRKEIDPLIRENAIRGYILFASGRPAAFVLGPIIDGHVFLFDYVGFDPDYQKWSPGVVLQYHVIKALFEDSRIDIYDLCTGEGEHKRIFASAERWCGRVYFFSIRPGFIALIGAHFILHKSSRLIVRILEKLDMKQKIKKLLRQKSMKSEE